jgi:hypothetical protein
MSALEISNASMRKCTHSTLCTNDPFRMSQCRCSVRAILTKLLKKFLQDVGMGKADAMIGCCLVYLE